MKLFRDGHEVAATVKPGSGALSRAAGDGEIAMFVATSETSFDPQCKWELEIDGKRVELAMRHGPPDVDALPGHHTAVFTAAAVG